MGASLPVESAAGAAEVSSGGAERACSTDLGWVPETREEPVTTTGAGGGASGRAHEPQPASAKRPSDSVSVEARLGPVIVSARAVYLATRKIPDGIWNRFVCRPLAAVLVDWVKDTRVTPNQITLLSALVAAFAAYLLAGLPGHGGVVVAIVVYEASYVLDCADGMLARLRGIQSARGHLLDFLMDELKAFVILAAASFHLFREYGDDRFLLVGLLGLVALASGTSLTTFMRRPEVVLPAGPAGSPSLVRRAIGLAEACGKFVVHYPSYIWLAALVDKLEYYLFPYVVANALYAVRAFASVARRFARE